MIVPYDMSTDLLRTIEFVSPPVASDIPAILGGTPARPAGPPDWPFPDSEVDSAVRLALADGSWGKYLGPHVARLSSLLADYHQTSHVALCSSGTAAVELALRGLGVGPGDEVLMAAYDYKANFQDVLTIGATPVLVDVCDDNWNFDPARIVESLRPETKALIVAHLHGGVVDMPEVMRIAREHNLGVVEDAAQAPGARIHGRFAGTWGDAGILSFGGSKLVTAGRGGAVLTARDDVAQRIKLYTQRGNEAYPLSELQAAAVIPQWERLDAANARRTAAVAWLVERLSPITGLRPFCNQRSDSQPAFYKLGFQFDPIVFAGLARDVFVEAVRAEGVALDSGFRALHKTHAARRFRAAGNLPNATRIDERILTLHHPVLLGTEQDLQEVVTAIEKVHRHAVAIKAKMASGGC
jgi:dTDP-4-amino-4,6-dideoxygalactose transaminase